jgi:hypothetical protein
MTLGWGFVIAMGLAVVGGIYEGLQERFGPKVIAGFRAYREEQRRWIESGSKARWEKHLAHYEALISGTEEERQAAHKYFGGVKDAAETADDTMQNRAPPRDTPRDFRGTA